MGVATVASAQECLEHGLPDIGPNSDVSAAVLARPRVHFVAGSALPGCPSPDPRCAERAYLVEGDAVVLDGQASAPGFVCALFVSQRGAARGGWLPEGSVRPLPAGPAARPEEWQGDWTSGPERSLRIRPGTGPGTIRVEGTADGGAGRPDRARQGAAYRGRATGEVAASGPMIGFTAAPAGSTLPYEAGATEACRIRLRLAGPYLLAQDNDRCGGGNATLSGAYRRAPRQ